MTNVISKNLGEALSGKCFHSLTKDKDKIHWQGVVVGQAEPGWYLVRLFSWLSGNPTQMTLVRFEEMVDWIFYADSDEMNFSWKHGVASKYRADQDLTETIDFLDGGRP